MSNTKLCPNGPISSTPLSLDHNVSTPKPKRRGAAKSTSKSVNKLREALQPSINEEIDAVVQKYITLYIRPGVDNIEYNQKIGCIPVSGIPPEKYIKTICKQILEEAKKMY